MIPLDELPRDQRPDGIRERIGGALGVLAAPAVAAISARRQARMFHPEGQTYAGFAHVVDGPFLPLGRQLTGRVLARCSAALWRGDREHLDVLGLALRFRRGPGRDLDDRAQPGDQDLLAATIRSPLAMLASPFLTDASDFAGNTYWAVSPFVHEVGRIHLRLVPVDPPPREPGTRAERLAAAVGAGRAAWWLEARRTLRWRWQRVARIQLDRPVDIDQDALAFDPFRGVLQPAGLVHAIRRAVYAASQEARPRSQRRQRSGGMSAFV